MNHEFRLDGKLGVVTGGAGLLGFNHGRALLKLGCNLELWDIDLEKLEEVRELLASQFPERRITTKVVDVSVEEDVRESTQEWVKTRHAVDILINNAALNPRVSEEQGANRGWFETYSREMWDLEIAVGLTGAMLCSKYLGSLMARRGQGIILNIASDLSVIAPDQRIYLSSETEEAQQFKKPVSYSVIKTGLIGLTRYLATYWAESGIRVNSLSPGGVFQNQNPEFVAQLVNRIPLGRMANSDEYEGAIQFLCSDASKYMTGQNLVIDGGRSVW